MKHDLDTVAVETTIGILHTAFLGDLALLGLLIEALHRKNLKITLVTNRTGEILYRGDPRIQKIIIIDKGKGWKKLLFFFQIAKVLSRFRPDVFLIPHRSLTSALLAKCSGAKRRVGFRFFLSSFFFHESVVYEQKLHERERLLKLASRFKPDFETWRTFVGPTLHAPSNLLSFAEEWKELQGKAYFIVAPGSVWRSKVYPPRQMAQLTALLLQRSPEMVAIVSGGPDDKPYIDDFFQEDIPTDLKLRLVNGLGKIPIPDLLFLIKRAHFVLCNDSAPVHLAGAFQTPTLAFYGPTSELKGFGPSSKRALVLTYESLFEQPLKCRPCSKHGAPQCPLGHHKCLKDVSPRQAFSAISRWLAN